MPVLRGELGCRQAVNPYRKEVGDSMRKRAAWVGLFVVLIGAAWLIADTPERALSQQVAMGGQNVDLLARVIAAEAEGEPYIGQVAVGAVVLNRVRHPEFPNTLSGVVYQPHAFESVTNGLIWRRNPSNEARRAAVDALNGWDPSYGSIFFWNPYKPVSAWIWSRPIVIQHGNHVFAR